MTSDTERGPDPMTFDPSQNMMLESLRLAWPERDPDDRPAHLVKHIEDNGTVTWKLLRLEDVVDLIEGEVSGDVS